MSEIKSFLIFVLLIFSFTACKNRIIDRYNEDQIVDIMMDAHTLGLIYNRQNVKDDSLKMEYFKILDHRYGLSRDDFQRLVDDLLLSSDLYDRVYKKLNDRVDLMERTERENM